MKKPIFRIFLATTLFASVNAKNNYDKPLSEVLGEIGDKRFCKSGKYSKSCKTPYTVPYPTLSGSTEERRRQIAANNDARNDWMFKNIELFKTATGLNIESYQESLAALEEKKADALDEVRELESDQAEQERKVQEIDRQKRELDAEISQMEGELDLDIANFAISSSQKRRREEKIAKKRAKSERIGNRLYDAQRALNQTIVALEGKTDKDGTVVTPGLRAKVEEQKNQVAEINTQIKALTQEFHRELYGQDGDSKSQLQSEYQRSLLLMSQLKGSDDMRYVDKVLEEIKDDEELANTLMKDLDQLKSEHKMNDQQIGMLEEALKSEFDNSVLGGFVQQSIEEQIANKCPAINACTKGVISDASENADNLTGKVEADSADGNADDK